MDNNTRAERALDAALEYSPGMDAFTAIGDLLCDLHHAVDLMEDTTWEQVLAQGDFHYQAEVDE